MLAVAQAYPLHIPELAACPPADRPQVAHDWFFTKMLTTYCLAWDGDKLVGLVGLQPRTVLPDGAPAPEGRSWEVARMLTHPAHKGEGIASSLLFMLGLHHDFTACWLTTHADGKGEERFRAEGWESVRTVSFPYDPLPGVVMVWRG